MVILGWEGGLTPLVLAPFSSYELGSRVIEGNRSAV
jgi:hypothetical protein